MKTSKFLKIARNVALSIAIGGGFASTFVVFNDVTVRAEVEAEVTKTRKAIAEYKKGNYREAIKLLEEVQVSRPDDAVARKIRDEVELEMQREFFENNLANPELRAKLRGIGQWLMQGRTKQEKNRDSVFGRIANDPEGVKRFVDEYLAEADPIHKTQRAQVISQNYGEFAVPYIHQTCLHDESPSVRAKGRALLAMMGSQAVMPLVQIMKSSEALDRENAALALGAIRDARALPVLKQNYEDASQPETVRSACLSAMQEIIGTDGPAMADAQTLWFLQAEGYYRYRASGGFGPHFNKLVTGNMPAHLPTLVDVESDAYAYWVWVADLNDGMGGVEAQLIPAWNYADALAEEAVGMAHGMGVMNAAARGFSDASNDPFVLDAQSLAARIAIRQYLEGLRRFQDASEDEQNFIATTIGEDGILDTDHMLGYASSMGANVLLHALDNSMSDGYPEVSVGICEALHYLGSVGSGYGKLMVEKPIGITIREAGTENGEAGSAESTATGEAMVMEGPSEADMVKAQFAPLVRALRSDDYRVRYAAATTLVALGNKVDFGANAEALQTYGNALAQTSTKTVMVIAEDNQVRSKYVAALKDMADIIVISYSKVEDGVFQAMRSPVIDAILMDSDIATKAMPYWAPTASGLQEGSSAERVDLPINLLKDDVRTQGIPLLLVAPDDNVSDVTDNFSKYEGVQVLGYGENVNFSIEGLQGFFQDSFNNDRALMTTNDSVFNALGAVHKIDPNNTTFNMNHLVGHIASSLGTEEGRMSRTRSGLAQALYHLASAESLEFSRGRAVIAQLSGMLTGEDTNNTPMVRMAVADAMGELFLHHPELYVSNGDAYKALVSTMRLQWDTSSEEGDAKTRLIKMIVGARNAAGIAIGKAPLSALERSEVREMQRARRPMSKPGFSADSEE